MHVTASVVRTPNAMAAVQVRRSAGRLTTSIRKLYVTYVNIRRCVQRSRAVPRNADELRRVPIRIDGRRRRGGPQKLCRGLAEQSSRRFAQPFGAHSRPAVCCPGQRRQLHNRTGVRPSGLWRSAQEEEAGNWKRISEFGIRRLAL
jgi:hypothetical protein